MKDFYVTTEQIDKLIDDLDSNAGDHMKVDKKYVLVRERSERKEGSAVVRGPRFRPPPDPLPPSDSSFVLARRVVLLSSWSRILDSKNKFSFMSSQLGNDDGNKADLAKILGFTRFKLNFLNPTGHWHLELSNPAHREVWEILSVLESLERKNAKHAGRGDTSQKGNWTNFRNEKYQNEPYVIQPDQHDQLTTGTLEFDYVSTTRPAKNQAMVSDGKIDETAVEFHDWLKELGISDSNVDNPGGVYFQLFLTHAVCNYYFSVAQVRRASAGRLFASAREEVVCERKGRGCLRAQAKRLFGSRASAKEVGSLARSLLPLRCAKERIA
jgi:hypothetical protein